MEQRDERMRGPKSTGADGGDLNLAQAELWLGMGGTLAALLRRVLRKGSQDQAVSVEDGVAVESQADKGESSGREAA